MRRHDAKMIARHGLNLKPMRQIGPHRSRIGREVRGNAALDKIDLPRIIPRPIPFNARHHPLGIVAMAGEVGESMVVSVRRGHAEPLHPAGAQRHAMRVARRVRCTSDKERIFG